jgi:hypothetical protein
VSPPITFKPFSIFFYEIQQVHAIEGDLNAMLLNPVVSTIPKWWMFRLLRWMQNLHQSTWDNEILYAITSSDDEQLVIRPFLRETKNTNVKDI